MVVEVQWIEREPMLVGVNRLGGEEKSHLRSVHTPDYLWPWAVMWADSISQSTRSKVASKSVSEKDSDMRPLPRRRNGRQTRSTGREDSGMRPATIAK